MMVLSERGLRGIKAKSQPKETCLLSSDLVLFCPYGRSLFLYVLAFHRPLWLTCGRYGSHSSEIWVSWKNKVPCVFVSEMLHLYNLLHNSFVARLHPNQINASF